MRNTKRKATSLSHYAVVKAPFAYKAGDNVNVYASTNEVMKIVKAIVTNEFAPYTNLKYTFTIGSPPANEQVYVSFVESLPSKEGDIIGPKSRVALGKNPKIDNVTVIVILTTMLGSVIEQSTINKVGYDLYTQFDKDNIALLVRGGKGVATQTYQSTDTINVFVSDISAVSIIDGIIRQHFNPTIPSTMKVVIKTGKPTGNKYVSFKVYSKTPNEFDGRVGGPKTESYFFMDDNNKDKTSNVLITMLMCLGKLDSVEAGKNKLGTWDLMWLGKNGIGK